MPYTLLRLAAGSYDLLLDGKIIGSVVCEVGAAGRARRWHAELLGHPHPLKRPLPFKEVEHSFQSLERVLEWLGNATVIEPQ
ncbi:hypothetical protein J2X36_004647 [Methylobacterium sp. BE186]|uniref:hypothetical protein n=1 Tax=Methylobacterium sp. BE186 TaxID=2817715 RepID=UPI0028627D90|nr:hypothetical protein [Methylobacterium sp. BE186]MDR7039869.1 hypothetical protein [Methylobacterium sp. BE186]